MGDNESDLLALQLKKLDLERDKNRIEEAKLKQQDRLEHEKLTLEREKLAQTRETDQAKQKEESRKTVLTAISLPASIFLSLVTLAGTIWYGIHSERQKARSDFEIKAAELVMNTQGPEEAWAKAKALKKLFRNRLPDDFAERFDPRKYSAGPSPESKLTLLKLTFEKPNQKQEIIDKWIKLFPGDEEWAKQLR